MRAQHVDPWQFLAQSLSNTEQNKLTLVKGWNSLAPATTSMCSVVLRLPRELPGGRVSVRGPRHGRGDPQSGRHPAGGEV